MFTTTLFIVTPKWKPSCPVMVEWKNELWCSHLMEFCTAVRMNKPDSREESQTQKSRLCDYFYIKYKDSGINPWCWKSITLSHCFFLLCLLYLYEMMGVS